MIIPEAKPRELSFEKPFLRICIISRALALYRIISILYNMIGGRTLLHHRLALQQYNLVMKAHTILYTLTKTCLIFTASSCPQHALDALLGRVGLLLLGLGRLLPFVGTVSPPLVATGIAALPLVCRPPAACFARGSG